MLEYHAVKQEYLQAYKIRQGQSALHVPKLKDFSGPWDPTGYNDGSITDDLITDVFLDFSDRTRASESQDYLRTLKGKCDMGIRKMTSHHLLQ